MRSRLLVCVLSVFSLLHVSPLLAKPAAQKQTMPTVQASAGGSGTLSVSLPWPKPKKKDLQAITASVIASKQKKGGSGPFAIEGTVPTSWTNNQPLVLSIVFSPPADAKAGATFDAILTVSSGKNKVATQRIRGVVAGSLPSPPPKPDKASPIVFVAHPVDRTSACESPSETKGIVCSFPPSSVGFSHELPLVVTARAPMNLGIQPTQISLAGTPPAGLSLRPPGEGASADRVTLVWTPRDYRFPEKQPLPLRIQYKLANGNTGTADLSLLLITPRAKVTEENGTSLDLLVFSKNRDATPSAMDTSALLRVANVRNKNIAGQNALFWFGENRYWSLAESPLTKAYARVQASPSRWAKEQVSGYMVALSLAKDTAVHRLYPTTVDFRKPPLGIDLQASALGGLANYGKGNAGLLGGAVQALVHVLPRKHPVQQIAMFRDTQPVQMRVGASYSAASFVSNSETAISGAYSLLGANLDLLFFPYSGDTRIILGLEGGWSAMRIQKGAAPTPEVFSHSAYLAPYVGVAVHPTRRLPGFYLRYELRHPLLLPSPDLDLQFLLGVGLSL